MLLAAYCVKVKKKKKKESILNWLNSFKRLFTFIFFFNKRK